jgi:hypothetical protein
MVGTAASTSDESETYDLCPLRARCEMGTYCVEGRVEIEGQRVVVETGTIDREKR